MKIFILLHKLKKAEYEVISTYFYKYNIYKNIYVLGGNGLEKIHKISFLTCENSLLWADTTF